MQSLLYTLAGHSVPTFGTVCAWGTRNDLRVIQPERKTT